MHDTTNTVTAEEVFEVGHAKGIEDERAKVLDLLAAQEMTANSEEALDIIWITRAIIKTGGHWQDKP
jgi:hypothetical protein